MGYILPIQNDTYTQYVNRTVSVQNHYSHILPTTAVQKTTDHEEERTRESKSNFKEILHEKMKYSQNIAPYTGKGNHFNEYV
ncbi:hypothetical protein FS935_12425 [Metabacillus litoralis]|uniref:Uncharacterized protein n=1 Tax=Metabacillus litoralis TaxID=152268 RepID=A0A5C6W154_9BACI|nr:hypothetical protein [Metabacillus litoralis]TXC90709.1 hypothetical protein FS935_12425 [Metabacillus litoralis]